MWFKEENCSRTAMEIMTLCRSIELLAMVTEAEWGRICKLPGERGQAGSEKLGPKKHCPVIP